MSAALKLKAAAGQPQLVNGQRDGDADCGANMDGMDNRLPNGSEVSTEAQNGHDLADHKAELDINGPIMNGHAQESSEDQSDASKSNSEDLPSENGSEDMDGDKTKEAECDGGERTESEKDSNKNSKVEDVIVIQDTAFTLKIVPPGSEAFELQVCILRGAFRLNILYLCTWNYMCIIVKIGSFYL